MFDLFVSLNKHLWIVVDYRYEADLLDNRYVPAGVRGLKQRWRPIGVAGSAAAAATAGAIPVAADASSKHSKAAVSTKKREKTSKSRGKRKASSEASRTKIKKRK